MDETSRPGFNEFVCKLIKSEQDLHKTYKLERYMKFPFEPKIVKVTVPDKSSVFEICYDPKKNTWPQWIQTIEKYQIPKGDQYSFSDIIVPTTDSVRNNYFLHLCVRNCIHVLICGPTGTGKTVNIVNQINQNYFNE